MPIRWYLIPEEPPPWTRGKGQRPQHCDDIRCNWVGHPIPYKNYWIVKVNSTAAKHLDLQGRSGVFALPDSPLDTTITELPQGVLNQLTVFKLLVRRPVLSKYERGTHVLGRHLGWPATIAPSRSC